MMGLGTADTLRKTIGACLGQGDPRVRIAVLDGRVDATHGCFLGAHLRPLEIPVTADSDASARGTHTGSLIFGQPGSSVAGLAPRCRGLIVPVFGNDGPRCSQLCLARAIELAIEHGAHIIDISRGEFVSSGTTQLELTRAIDRCVHHNVMIVAAVTTVGLDAAEPILAVDAIHEPGHLPFERIGGHARSGRYVLAPGSNIEGAALQGGIAHRSGASCAAALVAAIAGLLLSHQLRNGRQPDPHQVHRALLETATPCPSSAAGVINPDGALDHVASGAVAGREAMEFWTRIGVTIAPTVSGP
ncbi:S8 family serine peptidase [Bradyrhizobium erythrophlei]|uniref:S8 family serine peptidase n=1 Tax=Bradyrhizobium erythrophlei TaxID=1437360 RepID=UPI0035E74B02